MILRLKSLSRNFLFYLISGLLGVVLAEELASEMENVKICKVNIDDNTVWASKFGVMSIPTLLIFKNGEVVGKQIGALRKDDLKAFIESHI